MNILHLGKYYPPYHGGMEHYLQDLAEEQVEQGHQVTVVVHNHTFGKIFSKTTKETINGVNVIRLKSTRPIFFTPLIWRLGKQIQRITKNQKFDVLHLHWPNPSLAFLLLNKTAKSIPWVMRWHADMVTESSSGALKLIYRLIRPIEEAVIKRCQFIFCSSPSYIEHSPALHKHKEKCHVIPLGIKPLPVPDEHSIKQWAEQLWPHNVLRLFHLGRLTFYKNQRLLIKAAQLNDTHHTIISGDGQLKTKLKELVKNSQVQTSVHLTGGLNWQQVNTLYNSCHVFCLPSHDRAESFGVVLLEAMCHDKIILVADTKGSGMAWLAEQYNKGYVFKSNDTSDLIKQLKHIESNLNKIQSKPPDFKWTIKKTAKQLTPYYQSTQQETT